MPWHREATKDAASCDKPRGAANTLRSVDLRMGQPHAAIPHERPDESIVRRGDTQGSETSQYLEEKKTTVIAQVAASERARAQTWELAPRGCGTETWYSNGQGNGLERPAAGGDSPVPEARTGPIRIPSRTGHVKPRPNQGGPPPKAEH